MGNVEPASLGAPDHSVPCLQLPATKPKEAVRHVRSSGTLLPVPWGCMCVLMRVHIHTHVIQTHTHRVTHTVTHTQTHTQSHT